MAEREISKLANDLLNILTETEDGKHVHDNHEILDALVTVVGGAIYNCADDHGPKLAALLDQWIGELRKQILTYPHDPAFHSH